MDTKTHQQFEQSLIDEFLAALVQPEPDPPPQLAAPNAPPRPYYAGPPPEKIERQRIEEQLRALVLVEISTARMYEILKQRLDEMNAEQPQQKRGDIERQRWLLGVEQAARRRAIVGTKRYELKSAQ